MLIDCKINENKITNPSSEIVVKIETHLWSKYLGMTYIVINIFTFS